MPRDKHTTSLGKARGGPRRTTRLDHRGWLAPRPPSTARRVEEEQEDKEVSVTASSESNDDASENESLEGVLDTSRNVPGGLVTNEVSSQIVGGWPVLANVVSTEEFTRMEVPSPETKNQSKAAEVKPKAATKPKKPKAPKTTQIRKTCHFCAASHNKVNIASLGVPTVADYFINCSACGNTHCKKCFALYLPSENWDMAKTSLDWKCPACLSNCCCSKETCTVTGHSHCMTYRKARKKKQIAEKPKEGEEGAVTRKRKRDSDANIASPTKRLKTANKQKEGEGTPKKRDKKVQNKAIQSEGGEEGVQADATLEEKERQRKREKKQERERRREKRKKEKKVEEKEKTKKTAALVKHSLVAKIKGKQGKPATKPTTTGTQTNTTAPSATETARSKRAVTPNKKYQESPATDAHTQTQKRAAPKKEGKKANEQEIKQSVEVPPVVIAPQPKAEKRKLTLEERMKRREEKALERKRVRTEKKRAKEERRKSKENRRMKSRLKEKERLNGEVERVKAEIEKIDMTLFEMKAMEVPEGVEKNYDYLFPQSSTSSSFSSYLESESEERGEDELLSSSASSTSTSTLVSESDSYASSESEKGEYQAVKITQQRWNLILNRTELYTAWDDGSFTWEPTESFIDDKGSQTKCYRVFIQAEKKKEEEMERKARREAIVRKERERRKRWESVKRRAINKVQDSEVRSLIKEQEDEEKAQIREYFVVLIHQRRWNQFFGRYEFHTEWDDGLFSWEPKESFISPDGLISNCYIAFLKKEEEKRERAQLPAPVSYIEEEDDNDFVADDFGEDYAEPWEGDADRGAERGLEGGWENMWDDNEYVPGMGGAAAPGGGAGGGGGWAENYSERKKSGSSKNRDRSRKGGVPKGLGRSRPKTKSKPKGGMMRTTAKSSARSGGGKSTGGKSAGVRGSKSTGGKSASARGSKSAPSGTGGGMSAGGVGAGDRDVGVMGMDGGMDVEYDGLLDDGVGNFDGFDFMSTLW